MTTPDVHALVEAHLRAAFGEPGARAAVTFVGADRIEVLRFQDAGPDGTVVRYATLGMAGAPMTEPTATAADPGSIGIVLGGSGNGEQIAANKIPGVRAALAWNIDTAQLAREHNDANVIAVGARQHSEEEALALIDAFLETPFSGDERHQRRIDLMKDYERSVRA